MKMPQGENASGNCQQKREREMVSVAALIRAALFHGAAAAATPL
jgi:hypothetical protein